MQLTPREKDKLLIAMAATVARRRLKRDPVSAWPPALMGERQGATEAH